MKIIVFTEYGSNYKPIAEYTTPINKAYCERHGYEWRELILDGTGNEYYYKKHEFIRDTFDNEDVDAIFYLDCDAVITNHTIPLTNFMPYGGQFMITKHAGELNGGVILLRKFNTGNLVNDFVLARREKFPNEQNCIEYHKEKLMYANYMQVLKHPSFNSLDYSQYPEFPNLRSKEEGHWVEGCFILHVPALSLEKRLEVLKSVKVIE